MKRSGIVCMIVFTLGTIGCSKPPSISFYPTWSAKQNATDMSAQSYAKIDIGNMAKTGILGMTMTLNGGWPQGLLEVKAFSLSEKSPENAVIMLTSSDTPTPGEVLLAAQNAAHGTVQLLNNDSHLGLREVHILALVNQEHYSEMFSALSLLIGGDEAASLGSGDSEHPNGIPRKVDRAKEIRALFTPGKYYIVVMKDGHELAGANLEIVNN